MKVRYVVNNWQLGSRLRLTPTHKIVSRERLDSKHTAVIYQLDGDEEKRFISQTLFAKKGKGEVVEEYPGVLDEALQTLVDYWESRAGTRKERLR